MKIAVNTRLLLRDKLEGIGWFTFESFKRITQQHPEHQFIFLFDRAFDEEFIFSENIIPKIVFPQARHPFLYYLWFEHSIPQVLRKVKADYFISPDGYISLSTPVKTLNVIHDINYEHRPEDVPFLARNYYQYYFPKFAKKASRIATVSEFSKRDIAVTYGIPEQKIDVVYNGSNEDYKPLSEVEQLRIRERYTKGDPYFLYVGSLNPRKNIKNLLLAFDLFKQSQDNNVKLLIVGEKMWRGINKDMAEAYESMNYSQDVIFTGRVSTEELKGILASSLSLTYISYFEGFGIPLVESMYCDVPIITSNVTSMPEVAGDAAILIDPCSPESIKAAMLKILNDKDLRNSLIEKGRIQRANFSWQKTSDKLWHSFEKMVGLNTKNV